MSDVRERPERLAQYDTFRAYFRPRHTEDLRPGAVEHIGVLLTWSVAWPIEEGPYAGQWALLPAEPLEPPLGWVPMEDISPR